MTLSRPEALAELTRRGTTIGQGWAKLRASWIPEEIRLAVIAAVDEVLANVDKSSSAWYALDQRSALWCEQTAAEIAQFLTDYTMKAARKASWEMRNLPSALDPEHASRLEQLRERAAGRMTAENERKRTEEDKRRQADERRRQVLEQRMRTEEAARTQADEDARNQAEENIRQRAAEEQRRWLARPAPPPAPQPYGVSHEGAESLACDWMRHLGVVDAGVTRFVGDGGIDVDSSTCIAQVKNYTGTVPVHEIRAIYGTAAAEQKHALVFTSGFLTTEGALFADRVGMLVFRYDAVQGTLEGLNELAERAISMSIPEAVAQFGPRSSGA